MTTTDTGTTHVAALSVEVPGTTGQDPGTPRGGSAAPRSARVVR
ncbi:hypothetical protein [Pseudonocardia sp. NPDC049154]